MSLSDYYFDKNKMAVSKEYELLARLIILEIFMEVITTCVIKNGNGKWYDYNDAMIREIPSNKAVGNKNYCLIYRLK